ncbi:MAG TPA: flagellar filament capping protein FliD [Syntrophales bacterium]|nr:flagellar filament capping protein FliD [Syntrophales bacterium]
MEEFCKSLKYQAIFADKTCRDETEEDSPLATSTNLISGLSSGFDWRTMVDQLIAIDHRKVDLVTNKKTDYSDKLTEWQGVNTKLLALKTAASALGAEDAFKVYSASTTSNTTTAASSLFTATTATTASPGMYNIKVTNLAQSEKISSTNFTASDTALSLAGDILISDKVVHVVSTDTLANIRDKINAVNTGTSPSRVTASIVQHSSTNYHLALSSDDTGSTGINILEGSSANVLQSLGFITSATPTIKTPTSDGMKSDLFSDASGVVGTLLGLSSPPGSTSVTIGGTGVLIDLSNENITTIASNINLIGGGISATVVNETVDGEIKYRIDISGTTSFVDNGNILQMLGIVKGNYGTTTQVVKGSVANVAGALPITSATVWNTIDGANVQNNTSFTITGKKHDGTAVSGSYTIANAATGTVNDLLTQIQTTFGATVTATIDGTGKITVTDTTAGDSQLEMTLVTNNQAGGSLDFGTVSLSTEGRSMQLAAGEDAQLNVDNVTITKSSNTISDVIPGVTLNLVGEKTDTTVTLKVDRDMAAIKTKITSMADSFNSIMSYINTQFSYDEETNTTGGILFGDGTLSTVKSDLISTVTNTVNGLSSDYNRLSLIGISLDSNTNLTIDDTKLTAALTTNFDDVKKLFVAIGSSPNSQLQYVGHTDSTEGGTYSVNITQAATRTTLTGGAAMPVSLLADETVTVQDYASGRLATVSLTTGMSRDDVVNAVNSELAKTYTEQLQGSNNTGYSSSTLFSGITGAVNGLTITYSGTKRNGLQMSGSYIVDTTKTLGDLLSNIEDEFDEEVTASMSGGKLIITDKQSGDSSLSFTINTSAISGLDFGTVSTTTAGRYAINITASKTGSNELLLTHNTYGTGKVIVVNESGGSALGLATATQVYGVNVAGTINSATATGSGQTLSLSSSGNNADGLSITYTGTGTTTSDFTLSLGIGDLMDRLLGFITDSTDGYVGFKQTSLQDSIDSYETRITQMEATLERKSEMLINRFVAMEMALSKLQSQSSWLSSQISMLTANAGQ